MSTLLLFMKTTTILLICLSSLQLHAQSGQYDANKIFEPTPVMLKRTTAELFKEIDLDGDGWLSLAETNQVLEHSPKIPKENMPSQT